jgi:hypothetical protein
MDKDDDKESYEGIPSERHAQVSELRQWMREQGKSFTPRMVWFSMQKTEADEYRRKLIGFNQELADGLDKKYPFLVVECASRFEAQNGDLVQVETYVAQGWYLRSSGLVSDQMYHDFLFSRRPKPTETGCSYELCMENKETDTWRLEITREMLPNDSHGKVSRLTKKGLKETQDLLKAIFSTKQIDV